MESASTTPPPRNFHLVVTEHFLNKIVSECRLEPGQVQENVLGTPVFGSQLTQSVVSLDLRPSAETGFMVIVLNGETHTTTQGYSPQAIVNSLGRQQFYATKDVMFNGYELSTRHARVAAHAENYNVGANTMFSGTFLGPLVEQIVLSVAEQRQPATEEYARNRVIERVAPEFDQSVDAQLATGNVSLRDQIQTRLSDLQLLPSYLKVRTTDSHLHLAASMALPRGVREIAPAPDRLVVPHEISIYLHESMLQGLIEKANLAGQKYSMKALTRLMESLGISVAPLPSSMSDLDFDVVFSQENPLEFQIVEEETRMILRATFQAAGQDVLPEFKITLSFRIVSDQDQWEIQAGPVQVLSQEAGADGTSITELTVKKMFEASLTSTRFPKRIPASYWIEGKSTPFISSIRSGAGWLVIGLD